MIHIYKLDPTLQSIVVQMIKRRIRDRMACKKYLHFLRI